MIAAQRERTRRAAKPVGAARVDPNPNAAVRDAGLALRKAAHRAIQGVTESIEAFAFNKAVAQIYELANAISRDGGGDGAARREALETIVMLMGPMRPKP